MVRFTVVGAGTDWDVGGTCAPGMAMALFFRDELEELTPPSVVRSSSLTCFVVELRCSGLSKSLHLNHPLINGPSRLMHKTHMRHMKASKLCCME